MYVINQTVKIGNLNYFFAPQHRGTYKYKSRWIIPLEEELNCFLLCNSHDWIDSNIGWSLYLGNNGICCLGRNIKNEKLLIAKFIDGKEDDVWHGYPADYVNNIQDRPTVAVLTDWVNKRLINKVGMSRIRRGMRGRI